MPTWLLWLSLLMASVIGTGFLVGLVGGAPLSTAGGAASGARLQGVVVSTNDIAAPEGWPGLSMEGMASLEGLHGEHGQEDLARGWGLAFNTPDTRASRDRSPLHQRTWRRYEITLRLVDGSLRVIQQSHARRWQPGESVSVRDGVIETP